MRQRYEFDSVDMQKNIKETSMNIFKFEEFIVPKLLTLIYDIILVGSIGVGLFRVFTGVSDGIESNDLGAEISTIIIGISIALLIPLITRIVAESILIIFKIEKNTRTKSKL